MVTLATTSKAGPQSLSRLSSLATMASPPSRFYWLRRRTRLIRGFQTDCLRICENLYWLKGSGKFTLHGLPVVYLSGRHSASGQQFGTYGQDDIDALRVLAEEPGIIDLPLTNEWPSGVINRAATPDLPPGISDSSGYSYSIIQSVCCSRYFQFSCCKARVQIYGDENLFYVELPGGAILSHYIEESEKFPVQFGRKVLTALLNIADKADWRNCKLSKEEVKMAESFKNRFEEYDPYR